MKDWKAATANWNRRGKENATGKRGYTSKSEAADQAARDYLSQQ
jgi:hypothetical protein